MLTSEPHRPKWKTTDPKKLPALQFGASHTQSAVAKTLLKGSLPSLTFATELSRTGGPRMGLVAHRSIGSHSCSPRFSNPSRATVNRHSLRAG